jgi:hypothetical protein
MRSFTSTPNGGSVAVHPLRFVRSVLAALCLFVWTTGVSAQGGAGAKPQLEGIDLQVGSSTSGRPLFHMSQTDWRWALALTGPTESETMAESGCTMTSIAMIANYYGLVTKINPLVHRWDPTRTSPIGVHLTLKRDGGVGYTLGGLCDICVDWQNGLVGAFWGPGLTTSSLRFVPSGAWPAGEEAVDRNLQGLNPSILIVRLVADKPLLTHAVVVAGWDKATNSYLILDPLSGRGSNARPAKDLYGPDWYQKISQAFTVETFGGAFSNDDIQLWIHTPL